jgi:hypothetical protein
LNKEYQRRDPINYHSYPNSLFQRGFQMKQYKFILVVLISVALVLLMASCKKSDSGNPAGPDNPASTLLGSGSISLTTSTLGNFSINGAWTGSASGGSGSAVAAFTGQDGSDYGAIIYGYVWRSTTDWDNVWLIIATTGTPISTGSYTIGGDREFTVLVSKGTSSAGDMSNGYYMTSGTCTLTSYSSTGMQGTFSGTAERGTETTSITNGSFNVTFGTGTPY